MVKLSTKKEDIDHGTIVKMDTEVQAQLKVQQRVAQPAITAEPASARMVLLQFPQAETIDAAAMQALQTLAERVESTGRFLCVSVANRHLRASFDCARLHRRLSIMDESEALTSAGPTKENTLLLQHVEEKFTCEQVQAWRDDVDTIVTKLSQETPEHASYLLAWIAQNEDALYAKNQIAPYEDLIPKLVAKTPTANFAKLLDALPPPLVARILLDDYTRVPDEKVASILEHMQPGAAARAAQTMTQGVDHPARIVPVFCHIESDSLRAILQETDLQTLIQAIDAADRSREATTVLRSFPQERQATMLAHLRGSHRAEQADAFEELWSSPKSKQQTSDPRSLSMVLPKPWWTFATATGSRESKPFAHGAWVTISEELDSPFGRKPIRIDLLELQPQRFRFECYISDAARPQHPEFQRIFKPFDSGATPTESAFRNTGMFRLQEVVAKTGAVAGINGNFYFDYGHYLNGKRLNIPFEKSPTLRFGDPVGWFVRNGVELCAPIFNRAAFVVTRSGENFIRRVMMQAVHIDGCQFTWDRKNVADTGTQPVLYTPLFGLQTPKVAQRTDWVIAGGKVVDVVLGGGANIPLTGFVLSMPNETLHPQLTEPTQTQPWPLGRPVRVENNAEKEEGDIKEAMGCGPQLVRNGHIEVDFRLEDFGRKDSSVMSFFLPRLFDSYEAARSFVGKRDDGTILLGTVSGRAFGSGLHGHPAGMTFGELAQLAHDLGCVEAMALDGGGSSSLILRRHQQAHILNVPTGGADVPRGHERFISTALLVHSTT